MAPSTSVDESPSEAAAASFGPAERTLVLLRDELYGGSWDELVADLEARQNRKPFVFKLNSRIEEDLERIARLRAYEQEHGDLAELLLADDPAEEGTT